MQAGTQQEQSPAFTVQMAEAGFSINVKMIDPAGNEVMLTFRAPLASHADKMIDYYTAKIEKLVAAGWQPLANGARATQGNAQPAVAGGIPTCRVHGRQMKPSRKPGSFYCSAKVGDGYCTEKVDA